MFKKFIKKVLKDKEKLYYLIAGIVFLVASLLLVYFLYGNKSVEKNVGELVQESTTSTVQTSECMYKSALNGECVNTETEVFAPLVGVMIENFVNARPQAGIADARVVYEAPVEGNITRFLAVFPKDSVVAKAGPVRSARPYYLDFISEYPGAMYMHVGGSPEALNKIEAYKIFDVNEFYRGIYFLRDSARRAPHNVYTSSDLWKGSYEKFADKSVTTSFSSWSFLNATTTCEQNCVNEIEIPFLRPSYVVSWKYNSETKMYDRFHGQIPHVDSEGTVIKANTVVVQHVTDKILDDVGRRALGTIGTGKVEVYVFGKKIEGIWKKDARTVRTQFLDTEGKEILLASGKIWIEVVPLNIAVRAE